jgi:hypothetical protein
MVVISKCLSIVTICSRMYSDQIFCVVLNVLSLTSDFIHRISLYMVSDC